MADWSTNLLIVVGEPDAVDRFVDQARGEPHRYEEQGEPSGEPASEALCFHSLYPVPAEVLGSSFSEVGHRWETRNWGVKWGCDGSQLEVVSPTEVQYVFSTPWGPPTPFLAKVAADFPSLRFEMKWIGGFGMDTVGASIWEGGELVDRWSRGIDRGRRRAGRDGLRGSPADVARGEEPRP